MSSIVILILTTVSFVSCIEEQASPKSDPKPLPPETFEFFFNNRFPGFMILDASRYWDTATEFKNFGSIRRKIEDETIDPDTKQYARSLMHQATERLKNSLKNYDIELNDKYDMYDFVREWKNIEDGTPSVHEDLYQMIEKNFGSD